MSTKTAAAKKHVNKRAFIGTLCTLDVPSDKAPNGSRGHRVILTRDAAEEALHSLEGMGVNIKGDFDGHDARAKCGVIQRAYIEDDCVKVAGYIYSRDFPDVIKRMEVPDCHMGMSYELADAHVHDMRQEIWTLTRVEFTGAAILLCSKAAYSSSRIDLQASADDREFDGTLSFDDGDMRFIN